MDRQRSSRRFRFPALFLVIVLALLAGDVTSAFGAARAQTGPAAGDPLEPDGQIGGITNGLAARGDFVYIGVGPRLVILDMTRPDNPRRIGLSAPILMDRAGIGDVHVAGKYAFVAEVIGGMDMFIFSLPNMATSVASAEHE